MVLSKKAWIQETLQEYWSQTESFGHDIFVIALQGSQNYELDLYEDDYSSDIDAKALILPKFEDFVEGSSPISHTYERPEDEAHIDWKDIRVMFDLFRKQNANFMEILFSDYYIVNPKYNSEWNLLRENAERIAHAHPALAVKALAGMSGEKKVALKKPYPKTKAKIEKFGYDPKQLHHIVRINDFLGRYIRGVSYKECLVPVNKDFLLDIKRGKYSEREATVMAEEFDAANKQLKDQFINTCSLELIDKHAYDVLSEVKKHIFIEKFSEEILNMKNKLGEAKK